ncbi:MAG: hypothetical protein L0Z50_06835 [Verrucomicrobiales bacterium]|nr:hypothetical protein [Verrucomicrobiales bacterium]
MKKSRSILFRLPLLAAVVLQSSILAATVTWDGGGGDKLWHNPKNWNPDTLPGPQDTAIISGPPEVTVRGSALVAELIIAMETALVVDGSTTTFTASSGAQIDGARLVATDGGRVSISLLDSIRDTSTPSLFSPPRFEANGAGSLIEFPDLTTFRARE